MKLKNGRKGFCLLGIALGVLVSGWQLQAEEVDNSVRPKVLRMQGDYLSFYQPVVFNNATFNYWETKNSLTCSSDYVDFDFTKDEKNQLSDFNIRIHVDPSRNFTSVPYHDRLVLSHNTTGYSDLDGDSVLDTMRKNGPNRSDRGRYILYKNAWIQVNDAKIGFSIGGKETGIGTRTTYVFKNHEWQIKQPS